MIKWLRVKIELQNCGFRDYDDVGDNECVNDDDNGIATIWIALELISFNLIYLKS